MYKFFHIKFFTLLLKSSQFLSVMHSGAVSSNRKKIDPSDRFETKIFVSSVSKLPKSLDSKRPFSIGLFEFSLKVLTDSSLIF